MTDDERKALVERKYLIRKNGYWYRPNASGYTNSAIQAGRYTLDEAERYTHPNGKDGPRDGMDYVHEDAVADPDWVAYRTALARIASLEAQLAAREPTEAGDERYQQAIADVVAWLRECELSSAIPSDPADIIADLATAIEAGEHIKSTPIS